MHRVASRCRAYRQGKTMRWTALRYTDRRKSFLRDDARRSLHPNSSMNVRSSIHRSVWSLLTVNQATNLETIKEASTAELEVRWLVIIFLDN